MKQIPQKITLKEYYAGELHASEENTAHFFNRIQTFKTGEKRMEFEGIDLIYREMKLEQPLLMQVEHPKGFLKIQFELSGHSDFTPDQGENRSLPVLIENGRFNVMYMPYVSGQLRYYGNRNSLDLVLSTDYLPNAILKKGSALLHFLDEVEKKKACLLFEQAEEISLDMLKCIREILHCKISANLKEQFIAHKVQELIFWVIDAADKTNASKPILADLPDCEKVLKLKQWIDAHPTEPFTLTGLSEFVALSPTKLKLIFKDIVKVPIMTYVKDSKLAHAKQLLSESPYSIQEIALMINYRHSQHFANAFKRKFGLLPSEFQKANKYC
ncbi:AraC family transcriptional regulator [Marinilongibacter aquaticus]|uniref:helix-turn-helix transcriptional regulator n=1 Tax=Marinilongibacter aquaticus TaxID=2975157 RepID=UPI0021BD6244|nr:AraC family transcriptional regulator [Marinilongibacter aquaticus]UBM58633.1 AraC family transcriptional regulator [Marinilongibacter aquaticus]